MADGLRKPKNFREFSRLVAFALCTWRGEHLQGAPTLPLRRCFLVESCEANGSPNFCTHEIPAANSTALHLIAGQLCATMTGLCSPGISNKAFLFRRLLEVGSCGRTHHFDMDVVDKIDWQWRFLFARGLKIDNFDFENHNSVSTLSDNTGIRAAWVWTVAEMAVSSLVTVSELGAQVRGTMGTVGIPVASPTPSLTSKKRTRGQLEGDEQQGFRNVRQRQGPASDGDVAAVNQQQSFCSTRHRQRPASDGRIGAAVAQQSQYSHQLQSNNGVIGAPTHHQHMRPQLQVTPPRHQQRLHPRLQSVIPIPPDMNFGDIVDPRQLGNDITTSSATNAGGGHETNLDTQFHEGSLTLDAAVPANQQQAGFDFDESDANDLSFSNYTYEYLNPTAAFTEYQS